MSSTQPQSTGSSQLTNGAGREPVGELVQQASQQLTELVRAEMKLAQAEMTEKGKRYGKSGGLFGGASLAGFLMLQALVAAVIAAVALAWPVWAAALIVTAALGGIAAFLALRGKRQIGEAAPPTPQSTIQSVKADVSEIKRSAHR